MVKRLTTTFVALLKNWELHILLSFRYYIDGKGCTVSNKHIPFAFKEKQKTKTHVQLPRGYGTHFRGSMNVFLMSENLAYVIRNENFLFLPMGYIYIL